MKWEIHSKTWGALRASTVDFHTGMVDMLTVAREGKPFQARCMIPMSDVSLIIPPKD